MQKTLHFNNAHSVCITDPDIKSNHTARLYIETILTSISMCLNRQTLLKHRCSCQSTHTVSFPRAASQWRKGQLSPYGEWNMVLVSNTYIKNQTNITKVSLNCISYAQKQLERFYYNFAYSSSWLPIKSLKEGTDALAGVYWVYQVTLYL